MNARLKTVQGIVLRNQIQKDFEQWKFERLQARTFQLEKLIATDSTDAVKIKFYQTVVLGIDQEIIARERYVDEVMKLIAENTEGRSA